jgi:hypothetical protein
MAGCPAVCRLLVAVVAIVWHALSFQWLRAPEWKDKGDARRELDRLVREHSAVSYSEWVSRLDQQKRLEFTSSAGIWYQATIEPVWDDKPGGRIRVLFAIDDGGRGAFHPFTDSLLLDNGAMPSQGTRASAGRRPTSGCS